MKRVLKHLLLFCVLTMLAVVPAAAAAPKMEVQAASTKTTKLSQPSTFKLAKYLNKGFAVKWSKVKNADGYEIYAKLSVSKTYKKYGQTKSNTFRLTNLKNNRTYNIAVRAYKKNKNGEIIYSDFKVITAKSQKVAIELVHGRYVQATVNYTTTVKLADTGKKVTVKAGTRLTSTKTDGKYNTVILSNGKTGTIVRSSLSFGNLATTTAYYTTAQKELYVNNKGYSSPTKYLIWISQYTLNTTVFKGSKGKWKVIRSMPCCVGRYGHTPVGVKKITAKVTNLYGSYGLYFTGGPGWGNAFHRLMDSNTRAAVSGGCVRLAAADLKFLYDTCPVGTTVLSY